MKPVKKNSVAAGFTPAGFGPGSHARTRKGRGYIVILLTLVTTAFAALLTACATKRPAPVSFTAVPAGGEPAPIILQWDPAAGTGFDWNVIKGLNTDDRRPDNVVRVSVEYLVEGIQRMTGRVPTVVSTNDLSRGIVLTTLAGAPADLRADPAVVRALRNTGEDAYNNAEAFYIRSESNRVLVVANRWDGLSAGIVELLETVGYEVLGMGASWVHAPDHHGRALVFAVERAGRPSYYIRVMGSGSYNGTTYGFTLPDPGDEHVIPSLMRLRTGFRVWGSSMPPFVGHALDSYHDPLIDRLKATGTTEGFLTRKTVLGPAAARPAAGPDNQDHLWINTDADGAPVDGWAFLSNGKDWVLQKAGGLGTSLDLSVPLARAVVFEALTNRAAAFFAAHPDDIFVFGTEPEDGSYGTLARDLKHPNWYPEYLAAENLPFGRPYALHGFHGLEQPRELWDPVAAADHVFAFNNWILREYDKWIDSLPPAERVTTTGKDKKAQVRTSSFSYNYHDVPPNFNLDPRIRVMVAGYPKNRGAGKWVQFSTYRDLAAAFKVLLPREPSGEYRILSLADYGDQTMAGIAAAWSAAPSDLHEDYRGTYEAGTKALIMETDFNYGKYGPGYYLISKLLWNVRLTVAELDAIRDRWLQRAYGSAWLRMKEYYDLLLPENYPSNSPGTWARAINLLDQAANQIDGGREPDVQRRFDELKQFWYFYYLLDSGQAVPTNAAFREFIWKCQTSYITSTDMVIDFFPEAKRDPRKAAGAYAQGPAHYTQAETRAWWTKVLAHWPLTNVDHFAELRLADGTAGRAVDLRDLVAVREFQDGGSDAPVRIERKPVSFLTRATRREEPIGFHLFWPYHAGQRTAEQRVSEVALDRWQPDRRAWEPVGGAFATRVPSRLVTREDGSAWQTVDVSLPAPRPGVYRFQISAGGSDAQVAGVGYDVAGDRYTTTGAVTFTFTTQPWYGPGQAWFYIPRGTASLDLEVAGPANQVLVLYTGLPGRGLTESRRVPLPQPGPHRVPLRSGEAGTVAHVERAPTASAGAPFFVPYLYSVPMLWARSPGALLVPRAIAQADGLTEVK